MEAICNSSLGLASGYHQTFVLSLFFLGEKKIFLNLQLKYSGFSRVVLIKLTSLMYAITTN